MARIQRPLSQPAVQQADAELYASHAGDPRPNPLYAADGTRRPLDATSPGQAALRAEWRERYLDALQPAAEQGEDAGAGSGDTGDNRPTDAGDGPPACEPVQGCPKTHRIALMLSPAPDVNARAAHAWWPVRPPGYGGAAFTAEVTDGPRAGALDRNGRIAFEGIPAGTCCFRFATFYDDVEAALAPR